MNQRPMKFRVWDKEKKIFTREFNLLLNWTNKEFLLEAFHYKKRYELVQFTGLKDKNKVEIYGGDVVKYRNKIIEVSWYPRGWWNPFNEIFSNDVEVIGNIYEKKL